VFEAQGRILVARIWKPEGQLPSVNGIQISVASFRIHDRSIRAHAR
jgi:hypothetical protein